MDGGPGWQAKVCQQGNGCVSKKLFMENAMQDRSTTLCRGLLGKS